MAAEDTMTRGRSALTALGALAILGTLAHAAGQQPSVAARPPAPTLTRASGSSKPADAAGFLRRWVVLEPIKVSGELTDSAVRATIDKEYFPNQLTVRPRDGETVTVGAESLTWHAMDTENYNFNLYHFAYALGKPTSNVLFWAVAVVNSPRELTGVRLAVGSNAASMWWVNGEKVVSLFNDRQTVIDDGVSRRLTLKSGANVIRGAIINAGGATDFCARFLDTDDNPVKGLAVAVPEHADRPSR